MTCPVKLLKQWFTRAYQGHPSHPLFGAAEDASKTITRTSFTSVLRASLSAGAKYLLPPHNTMDCSEFSGISFRKGSLSALSGCVEFNRLRERADHKCAESTAVYVTDSMDTRAQSSRDVHERFPRRHTQGLAPQAPQHNGLKTSSSHRK